MILYGIISLLTKFLKIKCEDNTIMMTALILSLTIIGFITYSSIKNTSKSTYLISGKDLKIEMNEDSEFFIELDSESLTGLYKVIDDYCLKLCKENPKVHRYIDIMSTYNEYQRREIKSDFGSSCYNINFDSIYALQSAYLFQILFRHKGTRCLDGECEIKPDFTVEFEYH